jgi:DNA-binding Lrp family transcriptional regulator
LTQLQKKPINSSFKQSSNWLKIDNQVFICYPFHKYFNVKEDIMAIEKTVSEIAEILGVSRQAVNNRVKNLSEEDVDKNEKGVTVVNRSGLIKLEEIYKKTIFEDDPIDEETKQRELLEILVDEKNTEITRLYEQLKAKDKQLASKDEQLRVKDVQIGEKDKQLDQQQQLTLAAMEDSKRLQLELNEAKAEFEEIQTKTEEAIQEQEEQAAAPKGLFARLFGKK